MKRSGYLLLDGPLAHVAYAIDLQVDVSTINESVMSKAVQDSTNVLLKQDWNNMVADVVRENQRQLVNLATTGVAFALEQFPELIDCSDEDRKEAWSTSFGIDPCYTTTLLFATESKIIDFYGIFAGAGGEVSE